MPYTLTNVPRSTVSAATVTVPDEVAAELVQMAQYLAAHPDESALATFDTKAELDTFEAQARSWAASQTPPLLVRRVRSKGLPVTQFKFVFKTPDAPEVPATS